MIDGSVLSAWLTMNAHRVSVALHRLEPEAKVELFVWGLDDSGSLVHSRKVFPVEAILLARFTFWSYLQQLVSEVHDGTTP